MFTPNEIQQLKQLINSRIVFFAAQNISTDMLTSSERDLLKRAGIDITKINPKDSLIYQSFALGMASGAVPKSELNKTSYDKFKQYIKSDQFIPPNTYEKGVIRSIERQSLADIRGLSNRFENFVENQVNQQQRQHFDRTIREEVKEGLSQKQSLRNISNEISKKLGDFSRDFDRIVQTTSAIATQEGRISFLERNFGEDAKFWVEVYPGACKKCIEFYLTSGLGSKPKIFKLNELPHPNFNYGKKQKDWVAVKPPAHPYCRCDIKHIPEGYVWDEERKQFVPGKQERKVERKSKVHVQFGDKKYSI